MDDVVLDLTYCEIQFTKSDTSWDCFSFFWAFGCKYNTKYKTDGNSSLLKPSCLSWACSIYGLQHGEKDDIYQLGLILLEIITGKPAGSKSGVDFLRSQVHGLHSVHRIWHQQSLFTFDHTILWKLVLPISISTSELPYFTCSDSEQREGKTCIIANVEVKFVNLLNWHILHTEKVPTPCQSLITHEASTYD